MSYDYIQKPTLAVCRTLEQRGGWSRLFARSIETREAEDTICSEQDPRFWHFFTVTREEEQFRKEVEECLRQFRAAYPGDKRKAKVLKPLLAKALLAEGWRPNISQIKREIQALKKERKEEISWLRQTVAGKRQK